MATSCRPRIPRAAPGCTSSFATGNGAVVFESGALNADGSVGQRQRRRRVDSSSRTTPRSRAADQVQIYESILGDANGDVTTGLLTATRYLKDNRLLPRGFDKRTADPEIAVHGGAADDARLLAGGDRVRYIVRVGGATGPFTVDAELLYQPIGFRWANNLKNYDAAEAKRFTSYYDAMSSASATTLARARTRGL